MPILDEGQLAALERLRATSYICSWDLAQGGADFNAFSVLERTHHPHEAARYAVVWLERFRDWRTARIPERTVEAMARIRMRHRRRVFEATRLDDPSPPPVDLVVDQTGVGPFALDPMRERGLEPVGITIHGGDAVTRSSETQAYRVPKRDLASAVYNLLEAGRLRVADLPDARVLRAELQNFRIKIQAGGHDTYGAGAGAEWRDGEHDDMVLSVACAAWLGEYQPTPELDPELVAAWGDLPGRSLRW